jgi:hypothetical protein
MQRLLFRLRREGLLDGAAGQAPRWRLPAAAAAVVALGVALTLGMLPAGRDDDGGLRTGGPAQVLQVPDVAAATTQIEGILREASATVAVIDIGQGAREIAATVPAARRAEVTARLAALGLQPPGPGGALRVELRPRP